MAPLPPSISPSHMTIVGPSFLSSTRHLMDPPHARSMGGTPNVTFDRRVGESHIVMFDGRMGWPPSVVFDVSVGGPPNVKFNVM